MYISLQEFERTVEVVDRIQADWPEDASDSLLAELLSNKAIALVYLERFDEATAIFRAMYRYLRELGKPNRQIYCLNNLAALYGMLGELDSAAYYLELAVPLCAEIDCDTQLELLQNLSTLASELDDNEGAVFYADSALRVARQKNNLLAEILLLRELAMAQKSDGDLEESWSTLLLHANLQDTVFQAEMADAMLRTWRQEGFPVPIIPTHKMCCVQPWKCAIS